MEAFAEAFDIRRLHLASDPVRRWYLMNSLVCGGQPSKFMARCPLVESFPTEFASVKMTDIQNSGDLDQRAFRGEVIPVASLFAVLCAVLRKNVKASEHENYASLIEAVNSIKMGTETERQRSPRGPVVEPEPPKQNVDVSLQRNEIKLKLRIENVKEENIKLKASLEEAFEQKDRLLTALNDCKCKIRGISGRLSVDFDQRCSRKVPGAACISNRWSGPQSRSGLNVKRRGRKVGRKKWAKASV